MSKRVSRQRVDLVLEKVMGECGEILSGCTHVEVVDAFMRLLREDRRACPRCRERDAFVRRQVRERNEYMERLARNRGND